MLWSLLLCVAMVCVGGERHFVTEVDADELSASIKGNQGLLLVNIYASWCGKCQVFNPLYEEAAAAFRSHSDKVTFISINADKHHGVAEQFFLEKYPGILLFGAQTDPVPYKGELELAPVIDFVNSFSHLSAKPRNPVARQVINITTPDMLERITQLPVVLTLFYAEWDGRSQVLLPIYEQLASAYADEKGCGIAQMEVNDHSDVRDRFEITTFPTIHTFISGTSSRYEGEHTLVSLMDHVNDVCGVCRGPRGVYCEHVGLSPVLSTLAEDFINADRTEQELIANKATEIDQHSYYVKVMRKVMAEGRGWVAREVERLNRMITLENLAPVLISRLSTHLNVLYVFVDAVELPGDDDDML